MAKTCTLKSVPRSTDEVQFHTPLSILPLMGGGGGSDMVPRYMRLRSNSGPPFLSTFNEGGGPIWVALCGSPSIAYHLRPRVTSVPHSASPITLSHLPLPFYPSPPHTYPPLSQVSCPHSLRPSYFLTPMPHAPCHFHLCPIHIPVAPLIWCHSPRSSPPGASTSTPLISPPHCWHHHFPHQILVHVRRLDPLVEIQ
jgi:hypothetical protein